MTTHRRGWSLRAGVVLTLVTGAVFTLPAAPALAGPPNITNVSASPNAVEVGNTVKVSYSLKFNPGDGAANISVTSSNGKLSCIDGCSAGSVTSDGDRTATFRYGTAATSNESATITIKATTEGGGGESTKTTQVVLIGKPAAPPPSQTVAKVCGKVTDSNTGAGVSGAVVGLQDSKGNRYTANSGSTGSFCFTGSSERVIAPGTLQLAARKDDITSSVRTLSASAGQSVSGQNLALALPAATPSATPSIDATLPTELPSDEASPEGTVPPPQSGARNTADEGGMGQWLLIIVGGLLVALGVGAIVLLWMRRKENDEDGEDGPGGPAGPRPAVPPSQGRYHGADERTRVHQAGADPTMMAGGAGLADAPTMMHNRPLVDDEFPDPYGAPLPSQQPGYGQQSEWSGSGYGDAAPTQVGYGAGYNNAPGSGAGGYNNAPGSGAGGYGNAPGSSPGYGYEGARGEDAPGGRGYGGEQYDDRTGRYGGGDYGQPADPYATTGYQQGDQGGPGYGSGQSGYDQRGGYGDGGGYGGQEQRGGYGYGGQDQRGGDGGYGYGQQPGSGGGYGQQSGSGDGYGQQSGSGGGYGQQSGAGGYDNRGGYGDGGGYGEDQRGGYEREPTGGYYGDQRDDRQGGTQRGGRRSVDWLDN